MGGKHWVFLSTAETSSSSSICAEGTGYAHALRLELEGEGKTQGYKEVWEIGHTWDLVPGCWGGSYQEENSEHWLSFCVPLLSGPYTLEHHAPTL